MIKQIKNHTPAFLASILGVIVIDSYFGLYYVDYEGLNIALISGSLTSGLPFRSVYFSGNLVLSYIYSFLYEKISSVEWISYIEYTYLFLATIISLQIIDKLLLRFSRNLWLRMVLLFFLFVAVFADHYMNLIYTRIAYLVCSSSVLGLIWITENIATRYKRSALTIFFSVFFLIGTLMRNEVAIACVLLALPFAYLYMENLKKLLAVFIVPITIVAAQSSYLAVDIKTASDTEYYKQIEPEIEEQFLGRQNMVPLSDMKTQSDSAKYALAHLIAFSDPRVMTPGFLRTLIAKENFFLTDIRQWKRVVASSIELISAYWQYGLFTLFLNIIVLSIFLQGGNRHKTVTAAAFVLSFWGLSILQGYVDKVNERSSVPYICVFILFNIAIILKYASPNKFYVRPFLAAGFVFMVVNVYALKKEAIKLSEAQAFYKEQLNEIQVLCRDKTLVINSSVFEVFFLSGKPFQPFDFSSFNKFYITDSYTIPFFPYYKRYIERDCNCSVYEFPSFWAYLLNNNDTVMIASNEERIDALVHYMRVVHGFSLPLQRLTKKENSFDKWDLYIIDKKKPPNKAI